MTEFGAHAAEALRSTYGKRKGIFYLLLAFTIAPFIMIFASIIMVISGVWTKGLIISDGWQESSRHLACGISISVAAAWFLPVLVKITYSTRIKVYFDFAFYSALSLILIYGFWSGLLEVSVPRIAAMWGEHATRSAVVETFTRRARKGTPILVLGTNATDLWFAERTLKGKMLPEIGEEITLSGRETYFGFTFDYELR